MCKSSMHARHLAPGRNVVEDDWTVLADVLELAHSLVYQLDSHLLLQHLIVSDTMQRFRSLT